MKRFLWNEGGIFLSFLFNKKNSFKSLSVYCLVSLLFNCNIYVYKTQWKHSSVLRITSKQTPNRISNSEQKTGTPQTECMLF